VLTLDGEGEAEEEDEEEEEDFFKAKAVSEVDDDEGGGGVKRDLLESEKDLFRTKRDRSAGGMHGGEGEGGFYLSSLTRGEDAAGDHKLENGGGGGRGGSGETNGDAEVAYGKGGEGKVWGEVESGREPGGGLFARLKIAKERRERERKEREERERARERVEGGLPDEVERLLVSKQIWRRRFIQRTAMRVLGFLQATVKEIKMYKLYNICI
jgi:hypothetical protein